MNKNYLNTPNFSLSYFGFNKFAEKLNGRIAMLAFVIIFFLEYFFKIKILNIFFDIKN